MSDLDDYALFVAIMESGSISAAARSRNRTIQSASRALARLERAVGTTLVQRTTRALRPTADGQDFYERIRRPLAELMSARTLAGAAAHDVAGTVRIGAPVHFGAARLAPVIAHLARRHPALTIDLVLSDRRARLLDDRIDLAVRIGELEDSSLRARRLADLRRVIFAAPSCLARHGRPATPDRLASLPCVVRTFGPERHHWPVTVGGTVRRIRVAGAFFANDAVACNEAVAAGVGFGMAPYWQVRHLVDAGKVEVVLAEYEPPPVPVHILWHGSARLPVRLRLLVDAIEAHVRHERDLDDR